MFLYSGQPVCTFGCYLNQLSHKKLKLMGSWAPWQRAHRGNASTKTPSGLEVANLGNQKLINCTHVIDRCRQLDWFSRPMQCANLISGWIPQIRKV